MSCKCRLKYFPKQLYHYNQVAKNAKQFVIDYLKKNKKKDTSNLGVVLDIDETVLRTYCWKCHTQMHKMEVTPIKKFYNWCVKNNISVFFITARPDKGLDWTREQLKEFGMDNYIELYLKPNAYNNTTAGLQNYKSDVRKFIVRNKEFKILINIGDQKHDLNGGFAMKKFLLNPDMT